MDRARPMRHHESAHSAMTGRGAHQADIEASMKLRLVGSLWVIMQTLRRARPYLPLLAIALLLGIGAVVSCSKKNSNPTSPGGGAGTNLGTLPLAAGGGSSSFTFNTAGVVAYKCGIHPTTMFGNSVTVSTGPAVDSALVNAVGLSTPGFNPSSVTVKAGGRVRWVNNTGGTHSVVNQ